MAKREKKGLAIIARVVAFYYEVPITLTDRERLWQGEGSEALQEKLIAQCRDNLSDVRADEMDNLITDAMQLHESMLHDTLEEWQVSIKIA